MRPSAGLEQRRQAAPFPKCFFDELKPFSAADVASDPLCSFAPIAVLANAERTALNLSQARSFAKHFGVAFVRWRLLLTKKSALLRKDCIRRSTAWTRCTFAVRTPSPWRSHSLTTNCRLWSRARDGQPCAGRARAAATRLRRAGECKSAKAHRGLARLESWV